MGAAEVAGVAFFERFAFLMADDHHFELIELGEAGADGRIVAERFVAVQLDELVEHQRKIIAGHRPIGMPRHFHGLPRGEIAEDFSFQIADFAAQAADFVGALALARRSRPPMRRSDLPDS